MKKGMIEQLLKMKPKNIKIFKLWFHLVGRAPVNGSNVYAIDIYITDYQNKSSHYDNGLFNLSSVELIDMIKQLQSYAGKTIDPYKISDHIHLDNKCFY